MVDVDLRRIRENFPCNGAGKRIFKLTSELLDYWSYRFTTCSYRFIACLSKTFGEPYVGRSAVHSFDVKTLGEMFW